ncbi:MAG: hypothetical protein AB7L28_11830 [Kofleriaceae bacterium]
MTRARGTTESSGSIFRRSATRATVTEVARTCLDDTTLARIAEGGRIDERDAVIEAHLDSCASLAKLVAVTRAS